MELVEVVELTENLELLMPTKYLLYVCGYHETALRGSSIVKPLDELAQLGDDWNNLIMWGRIEQLEKSSEHEFLSECGHAHTLRSCFSLSWTFCLSPILLR